MKQQSGFTLIELIVVIVILGILAAVALPKFSSLSEDARIAKMNGLVGSLKGAAAMVHGQALAQNVASNATVTGTEDGTQVLLSAYYPAASGTPSIINIVGGTDYASAVMTGVTGGYIEFYPDATRTSCVVRYYEATQTTPGASSVPQYDVSAISRPGLCV